MARDKLSFRPTIAKPCEELWATMQGGSRERHCELCDKQVHNFAAMTSREIDRVVREADGKLCARIKRRGDGSLVTLDAGPRASVAAQIITSASLIASAVGLAAQSAPGTQVVKANAAAQPVSATQNERNTTIGEVVVVEGQTIEPVRESLTTEIEDGPSAEKGEAVLRGTVLKPDGSGPMKGATISICSAAGEAAHVRSDAQGHFRTAVPAGSYDIHLTDEKNTTTFRAFTLSEGEQQLPPLTLSTTVTVTAQAFDSTTMGTMEAVIGPRPWWYPFRHPIGYLKQALHKS